MVKTKSDRVHDLKYKYTKGCGDQMVSVRKRKLVQAGTQAGAQAETNVGQRQGHKQVHRQGRGMDITQGHRRGIVTGTTKDTTMAWVL